MTLRTLGVPLFVLVLSMLAGCERPPIETVQTGFRGTGMEQIYNPRTLATQAALNKVPEAAPAIAPRPGAPTAGAVYQNVKVLGDLNIGEFGRTMNAMTEWVSPEQGCSYCHVDGNFADDSKYAKNVARRMLQMTKHINADWKTHVAETGVTCFTCHRGKNVPAQIWFKPVPGKFSEGSMADHSGQNKPAKSVGYTSLPYDPFTPFLLEDKPIRVNGKEALAMTGSAANRSSTKQAEYTYGLMTHMSNSLGVNCTFCHNTRSFASWEGESTPKRATAWYGIRMAQDLNSNYVVPLAPMFPPHRIGPAGDGPKLNCATCHQGAFKPLYGAAMAKDYPALKTPLAPDATKAATTADTTIAKAEAPAK
jgi:photosynthetic reaction center cytochrome c subunit